MLLGTDTFALGQINIEELINQADRDKDGEVKLLKKFKYHK